MSQQPNHEVREQLADAFQELADKDTFFRDGNAELAGRFIEQSEPSWGAARVVAAFVATDATDGLWARTAKIVRGEDKPTAGAALDPRADHRTVQAIIDGLAGRSSRAGDTRTATWLSQLSYRSNTRNQRMDENRQTIEDHPDIDQREIRASSINKAKMVFQVLGGIALTSPLYEKKPTRIAGVGLVQLGTWLGEVGERSFRKKVGRLKAEADVKRASPYPLRRS